MATSCILDSMSKDKSYYPLYRAYKKGGQIVLNKDDLIAVKNGKELYLAGTFKTFKENEKDLKVDDYDLLIVYGDKIADYIACNYAAFHNEADKAFIYTYNSLEKITLRGEDIRPLDMSHLDVIAQKYGFYEEEEIKDRLEKGLMFGVYIDDVLAGFIGVHLDASMGMLEIFEEYRHRGLAYELEGYLINYLLDHKEEVYCFVMDYNNASMALQNKLGLTKGKKINWVYKD